LQDLVEGECQHRTIILSHDSEIQGSYLYKSVVVGTRHSLRSPPRPQSRPWTTDR
jgi:hypothetical protein